MKKEILFNISTTIIIILLFLYVLFQINGYTYTISTTDRNNPIIVEKTGSLYIHSTPEEANVYIDDIEYKTPATLKSLNQKDYKILIQKVGYEDYETTVRIIPGEVKLVDARLVSKGLPIESAKITDGELTSSNLKTNELFVLSNKNNILHFQIFKFTKSILPFSTSEIVQRNIYLTSTTPLDINSFNCQGLFCILFTKDNNIYVANLETGTLNKILQATTDSFYDANFVDDGTKVVLWSKSIFYLINLSQESFEISYKPENTDIVNYVYTTPSDIILVTRDTITKETTVREL